MRRENMYNDPIHNDPTEYHRPPEPLPTAYRNPYEISNPYDGAVSAIIPPPPPKQRHAGLLVALVSLLCVVMILGGVIFGILPVSGQQQAKQAKQATQVTQVTQVTPPPC